MLQKLTITTSLIMMLAFLKANALETTPVSNYLQPDRDASPVYRTVSDSNGNLYSIGMTWNKDLWNSSSKWFVLKTTTDSSVSSVVVDEFNNQGEGIQTYSIVKGNKDELFVFGGQGNKWRARKSEDLGLTWTNTEQDLLPNAKLTFSMNGLMARNGDLYAGGQICDKFQNNYWRVIKSTDKGQSWGLADVVEGAELCSNSSSVAGMAESSGGNIFASGWWRINDVPSTALTRIMRSNGSWANADTYTGESNLGAFPYKMFSGENSEVFTLGFESAPDRKYRCFLRGSFDEGNTWVTLDTFGDKCVYWDGVVKDGKIFVVGQIIGEDGLPRGLIRSSHDKGQTWETYQSLGRMKYGANYKGIVKTPKGDLFVSGGSRTIQGEVTKGFEAIVEKVIY